MKKKVVARKRKRIPKPQVVNDYTESKSIPPYIQSLPEGKMIIGVSRGITKNLGNYESMRLDSFAQKMIDEEDLEEELEELAITLEDQLMEQYEDIDGE